MLVRLAMMERVLAVRHATTNGVNIIAIEESAFTLVRVNLTAPNASKVA